MVGLEGEGTARDRLRGVGGRARGRGDAGGGTRARQRIDSRAERRERGPERASRGHSVVRHGPAFPPTSFFCTRRRRAPTHPSVQPHISPTRRCPFYGARSHLLRSVGPERRRASRLFLLGRVRGTTMPPPHPHPALRRTPALFVALTLACLVGGGGSAAAQRTPPKAACNNTGSGMCVGPAFFPPLNLAAPWPSPFPLTALMLSMSHNHTGGSSPTRPALSASALPSTRRPAAATGPRRPSPRPRSRARRATSRPSAAPPTSTACPAA